MTPTYFIEDNPTAELVRQVLGAISQFDKAQLVMKLKAARDRKSAKQGKRIEGRKGYHLLSYQFALGRHSPNW